MRSALLLVFALAGPAVAQRPAVTEVGTGAVVTFASRDFVGGGVVVGYRPGVQGRVGGLVAGGDLSGRPAVRAEATVQFLLNPGAQRGVTLYGAVGAAFVGARAAHGAGYLTAFLGVERAAGRRSGWFAEAGFGGGVRLTAGMRWRRMPRRGAD